MQFVIVDFASSILDHPSIQNNTETVSDDSFDDPGDEREDHDLLSFQDYHFKEHSIYEDRGQGIDYNDTLFRNFPHNVYFKKENFIEDVHYGQNYDTITWYFFG